MFNSKDLNNELLEKVVGGEIDPSLVIFPKGSWIQGKDTGTRLDEETFYIMDVVEDKYQLISYSKVGRIRSSTSYNKKYRGFRKQKEFEKYKIVDKPDWIKDNPSF